MAYLKFLKTKELLPCTVIPQGEHIVLLNFQNPQDVNLDGFNLYLDSDGTIDIGGKAYQEYNTLYRSIDDLAYQLSNDGSVYVLPEEQPVHEPTEEELEEIERQRNISELQSQIQQKKEKLAQTDYIPVKLYEYFLAGKECTEYEISEVHTQRQSIRDEINSLESNLAELIK